MALEPLLLIHLIRLFTFNIFVVGFHSDKVYYFSYQAQTASSLVFVPLAWFTMELSLLFLLSFFLMGGESSSFSLKTSDYYMIQIRRMYLSDKYLIFIVYYPQSSML